MTGDPGVFTISLDTELAWGSFDKGGVRRYGAAYRETPDLVERLCGLFERYDVPATWAFVAHLFEECADHDAAPSERATWLADAPCSTGVERSLWYAPELLSTVRGCATPQEVGLHGYSHLVFDQHTRQAARAELDDALAVARANGLEPSAFVFPRNGSAHLDLLADRGFAVVRGRDARWYERARLGAARKPLRLLDEAARLSPPVVTPVEREGIVVVPGSQIFRPDRGPWGLTPAATPVVRARKGLDRAAKTGRVFHLWFHPFNMASDPDHHLGLFEQILSYADELRETGRLEIRPLSGVARAFRDGRWRDDGMEGSPA